MKLRSAKRLPVVLDRGGALEALARGERSVLELGCGPRKRHTDAVGVDTRDLEGVDVVGDVFEVLAKLPEGSVGQVISSHFVEHVESLPELMHEIARVLEPGGTTEVVVPHFSNPYFYSDYTHRRCFGLYTFSYLVKDPILRRRVPRYGEVLPLTLSSVHLGFRSVRPFFVRRLWKKLLGLVFDSSIYARELYEENFCFLFPCYEIRFVMVKDAAQAT